MSFHRFDENVYMDVLITNAAQGSANTSYVAPFADGGGANRAVFALVLGAAAGNVDFKLQQATNSSGGSVKDITGAAVTTITTSTDECLVTIEVTPSALDDINGFKYIRGVVTVASGTPAYTVLYIKHALRRAGEFTQGADYTQAVFVD